MSVAAREEVPTVAGALVVAASQNVASGVQTFPAVVQCTSAGAADQSSFFISAVRARVPAFKRVSNSSSRFICCSKGFFSVARDAALARASRQGYFSYGYDKCSGLSLIAHGRL